jgi:hypothetical protein
MDDNPESEQGGKMIDKLPKDLKRAIDESPTGAVMAKSPVTAPFPDMNKVGALFIEVRDDIARTAGKDPESVILVGVKVFYTLGKEPVGDGKYYYAVGARSEYDPEYEHIIKEIQ